MIDKWYDTDILYIYGGAEIASTGKCKYGK